MDTKRKVTVIDLEIDGPAAVKERQARAEAAAQKRLDEVRRDAEVQEPVKTPPAADSQKSRMGKAGDESQGGGQDITSEEESATVPSQPAVPTEKQHQLEALASSQPTPSSASPLQQDGSQEKAVGSQMKMSPPDGEAEDKVQAQDPAFNIEKKSNIRHSAKRVPGKNEPGSLSGRGASDAFDAKVTQRGAPRATRGKIIRMEYVASPPPATEVTGNFLVDELNRFMDEWLVPDDVPPIAKEAGTAAAGGFARDRLPRDVQVAQTPSGPDLRQFSSLHTGRDWRQSLLQCCGGTSARGSTTCPLCNQSIGEVDDSRTPSLSRKWTRWIFRQCEEPLDMEAEFLLTTMDKPQYKRLEAEDDTERASLESFEKAKNASMRRQSQRGPGESAHSTRRT